VSNYFWKTFSGPDPGFFFGGGLKPYFENQKRGRILDLSFQVQVQQAREVGSWVMLLLPSRYEIVECSLIESSFYELSNEV